MSLVSNYLGCIKKKHPVYLAVVSKKWCMCKEIGSHKVGVADISALTVKDENQ